MTNSIESNNPSKTEQQINALQSIGELNGLTREELQWIANASSERHVESGALVFRQGEPLHHLIFVLTGVVLIKRHTSSSVTFFTDRTGRITGKTPFSRIHTWNADGRALGNVCLLEIHESKFKELLASVPSMTERIVRVLIDRNREYTRAEEQIGKLLALSKLAGNLAHELNNPVSAARNAAFALSPNSELSRSDTRYQLGQQFSDQEALNSYVKALNAIRLAISEGLPASNPLRASEMQEALNDWLDKKGLEQAWNLTSILAETDVSFAQLEGFLASIPDQLQPLALRDLVATINQDLATSMILQASERTFRIVSAVKDYSYLNWQPLQEVDIGRSLDEVLMMHQPRLRNVVVKKIIPPRLPLLQGYGSELNQAFSALIENSLDAMEDEGTLTLSVRVKNGTFLIDIEDDGCGIPLEHPDRIFEPFFTTKPFGGGLGLGLDTVQRVVGKHFGAVAFDTSPQGTTFHVRLPIDRIGIY